MNNHKQESEATWEEFGSTIGKPRLKSSSDGFLSFLWTCSPERRAAWYKERCHSHALGCEHANLPKRRAAC